MNHTTSIVLSETYDLEVTYDDIGYQDGRVRIDFLFYVNGVNTEVVKYSYLGDEVSKFQINNSSTFREAGKDLPYYKFLWWDRLNWDQKDEVRNFVRGIINKMPHTRYMLDDWDLFEEKEEK